VRAVVGSVTVSKMQNLTFLYDSEDGTFICKSWVYKSVNVSSIDICNVPFMMCLYRLLLKGPVDTHRISPCSSHLLIL
jgi:hypothetical protein